MKKDDRYNSFSYKTGRNTVTKGFFNVYQAKSGAIYIQMGITITKLLESQITDLGLDVYSLIDFSHDDYIKHYKTEAPGLALNERKK